MSRTGPNWLRLRNGSQGPHTAVWHGLTTVGPYHVGLQAQPQHVNTPHKSVYLQFRLFFVCAWDVDDNGEYTHEDRTAKKHIFASSCIISFWETCIYVARREDHMNNNGLLIISRYSVIRELVIRNSK